VDPIKSTAIGNLMIHWIEKIPNLEFRENRKQSRSCGEAVNFNNAVLMVSN
jgi:hypothetical protein